ncbi:UNVERIFIED_CONTAM: hypothetical protein Sradi_5824900 [Sesamum radiatum]|uniref:Uncharacterized protein n=1 Tax=Sesamum radiatum TaxID=300843 RepID=A0AAW2KRK5_SESRA
MVVVVVLVLVCSMAPQKKYPLWPDPQAGFEASVVGVVFIMLLHHEKHQRLAVEKAGNDRGPAKTSTTSWRRRRWTLHYHGSIM